MALQKSQTSRTKALSTILVASPYAVHAPYGPTAVVLLVRRDHEAASGIILNAESRKFFSQFDEQLRDPPDQKASDLSTDQEMTLSLVNWESGELLSELEQGIWLTAAVERGDLVREHLWVELVRRVSRSVIQDSLGIKRFPEDPTAS